MAPEMLGNVPRSQSRIDAVGHPSSSQASRSCERGSLAGRLTDDAPAATIIAYPALPPALDWATSLPELRRASLDSEKFTGGGTALTRSVMAPYPQTPFPGRGARGLRRRHRRRWHGLDGAVPTSLNLCGAVRERTPLYPRQRPCRSPESLRLILLSYDCGSGMRTPSCLDRSAS